MSDTFSKGSRYDALGRDVYNTMGRTLPDTMLYAGMGLKAHRQGYSVLYGDWHVQWYGDPDQTIIWHGQGRGSIWRDRPNYRDAPGAYGGAGDVGLGLLANNIFLGGPFPASHNGVAWREGPAWKYSSWKIWSDFDMQNGIDVHDTDRVYYR